MMKQKANEADQESDLRDAFKIFDRDRNGYIDMKELKQVFVSKLFCPSHNKCWKFFIVCG